MSSGNTSCPEDTMGESPIIESSEQQDENRKQKTISSSDARYTFDAAKLKELKKQSPWKNDPRYFKKVAISPSSITKMVRSHQGFMYYYDIVLSLVQFVERTHLNIYTLVCRHANSQLIIFYLSMFLNFHSKVST